MTDDALKAAGYQHFPRSSGFLNHADDLWQLAALTADDKKAYFINVWVYDFKDFHSMPPEAKAKNRYSVEVQFSLPSGDVFNVSRNVSEMTIEAVEVWLAEVYKALGCIPDIHN